MNRPSPRPQEVKLRTIILNLLLFALIFTGVQLWRQRDMPSGPAPALQGLTLNGQPYTLPRQPGKPVLVHFWATWCPICASEQDSIEAIARDHPGVITIALQSGPPQAVARHMQQQNLNFPVLNDPDGSLSAAWGVHAVPASFILAPDGTIRFVTSGYSSSIGLRLRLWLAGL